MRCWKVVRSTPDQGRVSVYAPGPACVTYQVGEWVAARVGGLLAFDLADYPYAEAFAYDAAYRLSQPVEIWRAEAREILSLPRQTIVWLKRVQPAPDDILDAIRACWEDEPRGLFPAGDWPHGTIACRALRLLERIASV